MKRKTKFVIASLGITAGIAALISSTLIKREFNGFKIEARGNE